MIYGRRYTDQLKEKNSALNRSFYQSSKENIYAFDSFRKKYSAFSAIAVAGSFLIFAIPLWHFTSQNYEIFKSIAYQASPNLIEHLHREVYLLGALVLFAFLSMILLSVWTSSKIIKSILGPLVALDRHMRQVSHGDWRSEDFKIRKTDEFRTVCNTYSYLYRTLRAQTEAEIKTLERFMIDPAHIDAHRAWRNMIDAKKALLGKVDSEESQTNVETAEESSSVPEKRLAS